MKWIGVPLAVVVIAACGHNQQQGINVPLYGSHFDQQNWLPAEGISERGAIMRPRAATFGNSSQPIFDQAYTFQQPYNFQGFNLGSACALFASSSTIQIGQPTSFSLTFKTTNTYFAQFASTNNAFQLTGFNGSNGTYIIAGYFNQPGNVTVSAAAANAPYSSLTTCYDTVNVQGGFDPNNNGFWSPYLPPPFANYWPNMPPNYGGYNGYGNGSGSGNPYGYNPTPTPTAAPAAPAAPAPVPIYRSRGSQDLGDGVHFWVDYLYSQNPSEGAGVYTPEGVAFSLSPVPQGTFTLALMRCLVNSTASLPFHFLSTDPHCEGQKVEGAIGWVSTTQAPGTVQLYRKFDPNTGAHLTTKTISEGNPSYEIEGPQGFAY